MSEVNIVIFTFCSFYYFHCQGRGSLFYAVLICLYISSIFIIVFFIQLCRIMAAFINFLVARE